MHATTNKPLDLKADHVADDELLVNVQPYLEFDHAAHEDLQNRLVGVRRMLDQLRSRREDINDAISRLELAENRLDRAASAAAGQDEPQRMASL